MFLSLKNIYGIRILTFVWGFQATPRPQCSEKYLESYTKQNNKKRENPPL